MATFRQRNGRWQAIIRRTDLKATKSFDRKIDAVTWARAKERDADMAGTTPGRLSGTLESLIDRYEREMWPVKRWGDSKAHELTVLRKALGSRLLSDLTQSTILTYARSLNITGGGVSARLSYLREVLKTARDLWGVAVPLGELDAAISAAKRMKIAGTSNARERRPAQAELDAVIAYAESQTRAMIDLGVIIRVLSVLPLRLGELLSIQWADLNADRRTAIIRGRKHPDIRIRERNDQEVPLIEFAGVDTFSLIAGRPGYLPSPFPYKRSSVSSAFWHAAARCNPPVVDLHIHDLRAHSLSRLLEAGVPIPQVALISGHKSWKILAKHYSRIDPASVHEAITRAQRTSDPGTRAPTSRGRVAADRP